MRTFFFVYLGFIAAVSDWQILLAGGVTAVLLLLARWTASRATVIGDPGLKAGMSAMTFMLPRGLATAVVAQLVADGGVGAGGSFVSVVTVTILGTVLIGTVGTLYLARKAASAARAGAEVADTPVVTPTREPVHA